MSIVKTYKVSVEDESSVTLEVNTEVLTPELALCINSFWSGAKERVVAQGMDTVLAVVRLFGVIAIQCLKGNEVQGIDIHSESQSRYWTERVLEEEVEGWPSNAETLGIRIVAAEITPPCDYFEAELTEVIR